ncbi:MAG: Ig-like domain-containing protein [Desulfobaccales bacterium]
MHRNIKIILCAVMLTLAPLSARADVAAISFTDPDSATQTVSPTKQYINAAGPLTLYLKANQGTAAGYSITDAKSQYVVSPTMTGPITGSDSFTVLGQTYYGEVVTTPELNEGTYSLYSYYYSNDCLAEDMRYECVSWGVCTMQLGPYCLRWDPYQCSGYAYIDHGCSSYAWVNHGDGSPTYTLVVDRTPPAAGEMLWDADYYSGAVTDNMVVGPYGIKKILVNGVSDANGIAIVQFESFNPSNGSVYYSVPAWYDAATQTAGIGTGQSGSVAMGVHLPNPGGPLGLRFIIYDNAGNRRVVENTVIYNLDPPAIVSWQYYRSDNGWHEITSGDLSLRSNAPVGVFMIHVVVEPRNYDQVFVEPLSGTCKIPAGQRECFLFANIYPTPGTMTLHNTHCYVRDPNNINTSPSKQTIFEWDLVPPSITSYTLDRGSRIVTFQINEPQTGAFEGAVGFARGWLVARRSDTGQEMQLNGTVTGAEGDNHQVEVDYASLPEGNWQLVLWGQDNFGNTVSLSAETVALDKTPPQIAVFKEAELLVDHSSVASLSQVRITLSDNVDANPELTAVRLEGGPQGGVVTLGYHVQDGAYVLEYPPMFIGEYSVVVSAQDASGNVATRTVPFNYAPPQVNITSTGQDTLNLPAIPAEVVHTDGSNALSIAIANGEAPLSGTYDLVVMSQSTSTTTLTVQGIAIAPGEQKALPAYDFTTARGRLDLPVRSEEPGQVDLVIAGNAPNFPQITTKMNFWRPEMQLSSDPGWAVQPIIQKQRINMVKSSGSPCRLTLYAQEARAGDPINDPVCLVQWTGLPANYQASASYAEGVLPKNGNYTPGYEIYIFNNGQQYKVASGGGQALERSPIQDLAFKVETSPATLYRKVQDVAVKLQSSGIYKCPAVTTVPAEAEDKGARQVVCLIRWVTVPEGLQAAASAWDAAAQLTGNFAQAGDQLVGWAVDLFSPYGIVENATTGSATLSVMNPPLPELSFEAGIYGEKVNDSLYVTSELQGGEVGKVLFGTKLLNTDMTLELDGTNEGHTSKQYTSANNITFSRSLKTGELGLWENRPVTMKLYYTNLPDWVVEKQITVVGMPSKRIEAVLTATNQTMDTTGVPVKVAVGIPAAHNEIVYDSKQDGAWRARLGYLDHKNVFQALTDYQPLTDGVLETTLTGFTIGFQKLQAQVELTPPTGSEFYARSLTSNTAYSTVLKGTAPEGQIYSRTLTGPAPLNSVMSLQVDSDTRRIMGSVVWQMSADNGATWQDLETKSPYQVTTKVNAGTYVVRAKMTNQLSGAVGYSEGVQLIAFKVPQLELSAPGAVIVGTPVTLKSRVSVDGQAVAEEDAVVEWYDRTGQKVFTGADLEITPSDTASLLYTVRAKMAAAPDTDSSAWIRGNVYVRVVPPKAPTGLIAVPSYMEYNLVTAKTYVVTAKLNLAMGLAPEMYPVRGEWHLPDGSVVEGPGLVYSPTAQDAEKHQALLEYVAWIEGFKEQTQATLRRSVVVGTYAWPEFQVEVKANPAVAPSLVTLTAVPKTRSSGDLEKPAYAWRLPAAAQVVRTQDQGRVLQVNFPAAGSFEVGVTITDARGSTAQAAVKVALGEPAPFQVEFMPLFSNSLHRELLDVTLRANVTGGHPQDRLSTYVFTINSPDAQVTSFTGSGIIKGLRAGEYVAHLRALSQQGKVLEADYPMSVVANHQPTCQVTSWDSGDYRWWKAACQDSDGRVVALRWYQDDKVISSGQSIRVKKSDLTGTLRFEAHDDAGGTYRTVLQ